MCPKGGSPAGLGEVTGDSWVVHLNQVARCHPELAQGDVAPLECD